MLTLSITITNVISTRLQQSSTATFVSTQFVSFQHKSKRGVFPVCAVESTAWMQRVKVNGGPKENHSSVQRAEDGLEEVRKRICTFSLSTSARSACRDTRRLVNMLGNIAPRSQKAPKVKDIHHPSGLHKFMTHSRKKHKQVDSGRSVEGRAGSCLEMLLL